MRRIRIRVKRWMWEKRYKKIKTNKSDKGDWRKRAEKEV